MKRRDIQREFLLRAGQNIDILRQAAESLPGVYFNIVDSDDRIIAFNRANCENCNFRDEGEIVGRKIEDAFPPVLAEAYVSLYAEVRKSGKPVINRLVAHGSDRSTTPRIASVFPIRDASGTIIGTTAFYRPITDETTTPQWYKAIKTAIAYIDRHFAEKIKLEKLAELTGMSLTTFRRAFQQTLSMTAGDYITTIRINHARRLLITTARKIEDIAIESGFYDQSHFIRAFKRLRRQTPAQYRRSHFRLTAPMSHVGKGQSQTS